MFTPSRDEVRSFFITSWQKHQHKRPLSDLEKMALTVIFLHPEYHHSLHPDFVDKDYLPERGEVNPFLHMSLHLTIAEQLSINQPYGIRAVFLKICQQTDSQHEAEHLMMESLTEMVWQANRCQTPPDVNIYLRGLYKLVGQDPEMY